MQKDEGRNAEERERERKREEKKRRMGHKKKRSVTETCLSLGTLPLQSFNHLTFISTEE